MNQSGLKISNDQKVFSEPCKGLVWTTERLGGTMTDITINGDGTYGFNGTSSKAVYNFRIGDTNNFSIDFLVKTTQTTICRVADNLTGTQGWSIYILNGLVHFQCFSGAGSTAISTATINNGKWQHVVVTREYGGTNRIYIKGEESGTIAEGSRNLKQNNTLTIGSLNGGGQYLRGTIDKLNIYEGALSASEVSNLYNKKSRVALTNIDDITILSHLPMTNGVIEDKYNTITNTGDVQVEQAGGKTAAKLTGSNNLAYASDIIGTSNALVFMPVKIDDLSTDQYLFGNDNFQINYYAANNRIGVSRDDSTYTYSANNSIVNTGWYFIGVYSTSTNTGIYIGTIKDAMAVSGTPASAGTLTVGIALKIGANSGGNLTGSIDSCFIEVHGSHNATVALQRFEQLHSFHRTNMGG